MAVEIPAVQDLGGVYLIDTKHLNMSGLVGVYLLPDKEGEGFSLIETGPGSTLETIKAGIQTAGFDLKNLKNVLVTHIHLDHAGAAGALVEASGADFYVHELGARHMIDPSRLMSSATMIYGDQMDFLWGQMIPVPEEKVHRLSGGEVLELGGHRISVLYTPGHAKHHVAYLLEDGSMFTGDAANIHHKGSSVVRPALPPPDVNLEQWRETVDIILSANPSRLLLTHFGEVTEVASHMNAVNVNNAAWGERHS